MFGVTLSQMILDILHRDGELYGMDGISRVLKESDIQFDDKDLIVAVEGLVSRGLIERVETAKEILYRYKWVYIR